MPDWATRVVTDLDSQLVAMRVRGIVAGEPEAVSAGRIAIVSDPDGNHIPFADSLSASP